jgi:hypothetical protein
MVLDAGNSMRDHQLGGNLLVAQTLSEQSHLLIPLVGRISTLSND